MKNDRLQGSRIQNTPIDECIPDDIREDIIREIPVCHELSMAIEDFKKGDRVSSILYSGKNEVEANAHRNACLEFIKRQKPTDDPESLGIQVIFDNVKLYTKKGITDSDLWYVVKMEGIVQ